MNSLSPVYVFMAGVLLLFSSYVSALDHTDKDNKVTGNYPAINLFNSSTDILGGPLDYPECAPKIHSVIITMAPGQVGKEHQHLTPLFAYILSGELAVTYQKGEGITKTYKAGEAFMEAMHVMHHGYNPTDKPVKLLAVYMNCAE